MSTKNNPGAYDCYAKLEPDEPYFVLRGKDPVGWLLVKLWVAIRKHMHSSQMNDAYLAKLDEAKITAQNMRDWAEAHETSEKGKTTDAIKAYEALR